MHGWMERRNELINLNVSHYSVSERIPATIEHEDGTTSEHPGTIAREGSKASDSAYSEPPQGSQGKQNKYNKYHAVLHRL